MAATETAKNPEQEREGVAVTIGETRIGPGERAFIVAEAGVNHNGCVLDALALVDVAVAAGADAVKFQMFRAEDLVAGRAATAAYQRRACGVEDQKGLLSGLELSFTDFRRIKAHCDARGILFLVTPFGEAEVSRLRDLGVLAVKIASTDLTNVRLLSTAAATGLPLIVSTGASTLMEIEQCAAQLEALGAVDRFVLLHCVSRYPAPLESINLGAIATLQRRFKVPCGFSDHTTSTQTGAWAAAMGACLLEKHVTLDPSQPGPDHAMSLDPDRLGRYVASVRSLEQAMGDGSLGIRACERDVRDAARRSVVASEAIRAGSSLTPDMLALKRPGTGIPPNELERIVGRRAVVDIESDTILSWNMLE